LPTAERSLRPHIRLYHTIVPCKRCGVDGSPRSRISRSGCIWMLVDDWVKSLHRLRPSEEPPRPDGLMPPLMHGTPKQGKGSSGGVTWRKGFYFIVLLSFYTN
jgi:hypothetical protein